MKSYWVIVLLSVLLVNCTEKLQNETAKQTLPVINALDIPNNIIERSKLQYTNKTSLWTLEGELFSGYAVSHYPDKSLRQKFGVLNGKKQNEATDWYPDGHLRYAANYHKGKLHGEKKSWTADSTHTLVSHLHYYLGKAHGEQKKWYATGEIFKIIQLHMGKEEGIQRAFRKNGDLFANYEARAGRTFGLRKASLCYGIEEDEVKFSN